jgi:sugar lactone lactonase YvrE
MPVAYSRVRSLVVLFALTLFAALSWAQIILPPANYINTIAGNGTAAYSGDGGPATSAELIPVGVAVDAAGNVYVADMNYDVIRRIDAKTGVISRYAGINTTRGFSGDGGPAASAALNMPGSLAFDTDGNLYIGDTGNLRIRVVSASTGTIATVAGNGLAGTGPTGDGGLATNAEFTPSSIAVDRNNNIYIADQPQAECGR